MLTENISMKVLNKNKLKPQYFGSIEETFPDEVQMLNFKDYKGHYPWFVW